MKNNVLILLSLNVVIFSSCYYDKEEELYPATIIPNDTAAISYSATIQPMLAANCATSGCHIANAQPPDLSTYAGASANKDGIKARAVDGNPSPMPGSGLMSADYRSKLAKWIEAGALNN